MAKPFRLERRTFLRGLGAWMALPSLECMGAEAVEANPKRFLGIHVALGMYPGAFFPGSAGRGYEMSRLLKPMERHRDQFTVFSGLEHPTVKGGHRAIVTFLTGVDVFGFSGYDFKNTISLDQRYAEHVGSETRFSSLQLATSGNRAASSWDVSWTREGIANQPISKPRDAFEKLFGKNEQGNPAERKRAYARRMSLLDRVMDEAKSLDRKLGKQDSEKLDEYLTSVRQVERRIEKAEAWATQPKPKVSMKAPDFNSNHDRDLFENMKIMYELVALAFETDSTRSIVLQIPANNTVYKNLDGVSGGYHALSHHGKEKEKIEQLIKIEEEHTKHLATFFDRMSGTREGGSSLLDETTVLFGSGLGNAASHSNKDLPILLAGGGYKSHGTHMDLRMDKVPLCNLYVNVLQKLGMEAEKFATSSGTLNGIS